MSNSVSFDYSNALWFIEESEINQLQPIVNQKHEELHRKLGTHQAYLGWIDWPLSYDKQEFERIKTTAAKIRERCDVFLIIGIGGSYLGAKAAITMLKHTFFNQLSKEKRNAPEIYFVGQNLSSTYLNHILELMEGKEVCVNVISKSGTTTEPAIAFRIIRHWMEQTYGKAEASRRIFATTDRQSGALKQLATVEGYETFTIPDDIGGRYSVLTAVGLLPMAVAGINIDELMAGAESAYYQYQDSGIDNNPSYQYAVLRHLLYQKGKWVEVLVSSEPCLHPFTEWWKQLFGESEGKNNKGIFPTSLAYTTDLHSLGQYIQDGRRMLFETILAIEHVAEDIYVQDDPDNVDGLNYLHNKSIHTINQQAIAGASLAHADGGVPNLTIHIPALTPYYFGQLVYFFEKACALSGYLLGVNPFDQPGVEAYKKNMFALLGKPGYEREKQLLERRLKK